MRTFQIGKLGLWGLVFTLTACAGGMSRQARSQVSFFGSFEQLQQAPQQYRGEVVMLGGRIIETQVKQGVTEIVLLQLELNRSDRPQENGQSGGRFIVRSQTFLDPALYPTGTPVTVVGRLTGEVTRPIGEMPYQYPVIEPIEIKKWPPEGYSSPRLHFGIGVGTHF